MDNTNNVISVEEIQTLIPHRYPFLLIDRVLDFVPGKSIHAIKNVSVNEPVFQGHFPDFKIFPGVMILEAMAQAGGVLGFKSVEGKDGEMFLYASVDNARFKSPVTPGDTMHIHVELVKERRGMWKFSARAEVDGKVVCSADLMCARKGV
ncbi:3-hydroxyacyl-ACP dehydratase FabZ [Thalassotalea psychrophila]|uniref:3-hydroxyacyl-[acyl-carrier-protein] dehydratase FabZ n=1 Tax=Thalassotalea psychrophila TaxID=3065647 RepID=A0ABY9TZ97_9GAMM|nr:3-hydroxyacyl-ACP dehydratase FabZ [Colwelliaceae bacterium SQ149]